MNKFWSALAVIGLATVSMAQVIVYEPVKSIADQHISLRGWGSGTIAQTDEMAYEGTNSIRVSSRNYFQGGIMTFGDPLDLAKAYGDKSNMLRLTFQAPDASVTLGGPKGGGGVVGGGPGGGPGKLGGIGGPGKLGGQGGPGKAGVGGIGSPGGSSDNTPAEQPPLSVVRVIITTTDGLKSEAYIPVNTAGKGERGWKQAAIPLQAITGFDRTNKIIKDIAFAGDSISTFYIGELRVINDTTPINGEADINRTNMALGDEGTLTAYGYGGASVLKYEWDFDSDGKIDAEGQVVKHKFRRPPPGVDGRQGWDQTITLIISDKYGLKAPFKSQVKVHINP